MENVETACRGIRCRYIPPQNNWKFQYFLQTNSKINSDSSLGAL